MHTSGWSTTFLTLQLEASAVNRPVAADGLSLALRFLSLQFHPAITNNRLPSQNLLIAPRWYPTKFWKYIIFPYRSQAPNKSQSTKFDCIISADCHEELQISASNKQCYGKYTEYQITCAMGVRESWKHRNPRNTNSLSGRREISCLLCAECSLPYLQQPGISSCHQPD